MVPAWAVIAEKHILLLPRMQHHFSISFCRGAVFPDGMVLVKQVTKSLTLQCADTINFVLNSSLVAEGLS